MSSPPIPPTPVSRKSFRSRVGTVVRRTSSTFIPTRASSSRASSQAPTSRESTMSTPLASPPLDNSHQPSSLVTEIAGPAAEAEPQPGETNEDKSVPQTTDQAPFLSSSGAITAEPEQIRSATPPPPAMPEEQSAWASPEKGKAPETGEEVAVPTHEHEEVAVPTHEHEESPFSPRLDDGSPDSAVRMPEPVIAMPEPALAPVPALAPKVEEPETTMSGETTPRMVETPQAIEPSLAAKSSKASFAQVPETPARRLSISSAAPQYTPVGGLSNKSSKASLASSNMSFGGDSRMPRSNQIKRIVLVTETNGDVRADGSEPEVQVVTDDPFADPPPRSRSLSRSRPVDILSPVESLPDQEYGGPWGNDMPQPQIQDSSYDVTPMPISMPLPSMPEVTGARSVRTVPSQYSLGGGSTRGAQEYSEPETDETRPLLARGAVQPRNEHTNGRPKGMVQFYPPMPGGTHWPVAAPGAATPSLQTLGWTEYVLPDSTVYFVHNDLRVATDINLRHSKKLEEVTAYFDRKLAEELWLPPSGWELWLRDTSSSSSGHRGRHEWRPLRHWVNHEAKVLSFNPPDARSGETNTLDSVSDDDRLDMEYRYWAFMEGHPAHHSLPGSAHADAMDALTWSYTDCLLPSFQPAPPPFDQVECQELMTLLRSLENSSENSKTQSMVHTRVVSRILMRVAQWRQHHFRPHKALPHDATKQVHYVQRRTSFSRTILDFLISVLCLGIPYIFMDRSHLRRIDEESNLRTPGPMLMIGACACLLAGILLSASVTFLSFPGLDDVARVSGFLSILCAAASMISWVISMFRYNSEMERTVRFVGGEGFVVLSKRSVVMSLPLVFLAYSIIAFLTGVTLYSFRGFTVTNSRVIVHHFDEYTKWTVVGTMSGFAGVLIIAALLAR